MCKCPLACAPGNQLQNDALSVPIPFVTLREDTAVMPHDGRGGVLRTFLATASALAVAAHVTIVTSLKKKLTAAAREKARLQSILRVRETPRVKGMFEPIAYARSSFSRRNGTPRQGGALVPSARCEVKMEARLPRDLLEGLDEYSHAWVIYVFHANTNLTGTKSGGASKGKVSVPRLDGKRMGVLATRTPHRPIPIGLSVGTVECVDAKRGVVVIGGIDLVDGTPVLDIKPYVPFCDSIERSTAPNWVGREAIGQDEPLKIQRVEVAKEAETALSNSFNRSKSAVKLYSDVDEFVVFVKEVLSYDIRSIRERNAPAEKRKFDTYRVILCDVEVEYTISEDRNVDIIGARAVPREVFDDLERAKEKLNNK